MFSLVRIAMSSGSVAPRLAVGMSAHSCVHLTGSTPEKALEL